MEIIISMCAQRTYNSELCTHRINFKNAIHIINHYDFFPQVDTTSNSIVCLKIESTG